MNLRKWWRINRKNSTNWNSWASLKDSKTSYSTATLMKLSKIPEKPLNICQWKFELWRLFLTDADFLRFTIYNFSKTTFESYIWSTPVKQLKITLSEWQHRKWFCDAFLQDSYTLNPPEFSSWRFCQLIWSYLWQLGGILKDGEKVWNFARLSHKSMDLETNGELGQNQRWSKSEPSKSRFERTGSKSESSKSRFERTESIILRYKISCLIGDFWDTFCLFPTHRWIWRQFFITV